MPDVKPPPGFTLDAPSEPPVQTVRTPAGFALDAKAAEAPDTMMAPMASGRPSPPFNPAGPKAPNEADIGGEISRALGVFGRAAEATREIMAAPEIMAAGGRPPSPDYGAILGGARKASDVATFLTGGLLSPVGAEGRVAAKLVPEVAESSVSRIASAIRDDSASGMEKAISRVYAEAVRPTVAGRGSAPKISQADQNVVSALKSIARNKGNLLLTDAKGREVTGRTPETLDEFLQAINQTKRSTFERYDAMAQAADASGARVDTSGAVNELRKFASDPALQLPRFQAARNHAIATAESLQQLGELQPTVAQRMLKNLNEGLTQFYRSSSPEAAGTAAVDDLVANKLRGGLDTTLEKLGLPGYQEARNEFGALKSIESEVAHRAVVYGRRDPAGGVIGRLGTLASAEEVARFLMTLDPAALASAAAIRGSRQFLEYYRGPNRAVRRMFSKIEGLPAAPSIPSPTAPGMQPPRPTSRSGIPAKGAGTAGLPPGGSAIETRPVPVMPSGQQPAPPTSPYGIPGKGTILRSGDDIGLMGGRTERF